MKMIDNKNWSSWLVVAVIIGTCSKVQTRSVVDSEKLVSYEDSPGPFSSSSSSSSSGLLEHIVSKRSVQDSTCRGVNDVGIWRKLDRVCRDCYNLYRKPIIDIECRRDCFQSDYFTMCVADLLLPVRKYDTYAKRLRGE